MRTKIRRFKRAQPTANSSPVGDPLEAIERATKAVAALFGAAFLLGWLVVSIVHHSVGIGSVSLVKETIISAGLLALLVLSPAIVALGMFLLHPKHFDLKLFVLLGAQLFVIYLIFERTENPNIEIARKQTVTAAPAGLSSSANSDMSRKRESDKTTGNANRGDGIKPSLPTRHDLALRAAVLASWSLIPLGMVLLARFFVTRNNRVKRQKEPRSKASLGFWEEMVYLRSESHPEARISFATPIGLTVLICVFILGRYAEQIAPSRFEACGGLHLGQVKVHVKSGTERFKGGFEGLLVSDESNMVVVVKNVDAQKFLGALLVGASKGTVVRKVRFMNSELLTVETVPDSRIISM